jgi:hypothetical protein
MTANALTNLQVFERTLETAMIQGLAQMCDVFNQASRGTIVLVPGNNPGSFNREALYDMQDAVVLRDVFSDDDVAEANLSRDVVGGVKVEYGTKPIRIDQALWNHMGRAPGEAAAVVAQRLGPAFLQQKLNLAIASVAAALQNIGSDVTYDASGDPISLAALNYGAAKFGDRSAAIAAWIMHSTSFHQLQAAGLTNSTNLFTYGTLNIMADPLGRPFIVTDSPDLIAEDGDFLTLGLTAGALVLQENPGFRAVVQTSVGKTNIRDTYQAEGSFNLTLKGCKWDEANGGASPQADALAVGTNWDQVVNSIKDGPGVIVRCDND